MSSGELMEWQGYLDGDSPEAAAPALPARELGPDEFYAALTRTFGGGA